MMAIGILGIVVCTIILCSIIFGVGLVVGMLLEEKTGEKQEETVKRSTSELNLDEIFKDI